MIIKFLGSGSAFTLKNYQSNILISHKGKNLLVDVGSDIRWSLKEWDMSYKDIDSVYISHAHADHTGGMEYLGFCSYFDPTKEKIKLFCEHELVYELWNFTLKGGMGGLQGIDATIDTYWDVNPIRKNASFTWQDIKFDIVQVVHVSAKYKIENSFGLLFNDPDTNERIFISTDCQFAPETSMMAYYKEADIIFHDCETMYKSGVHSHYDDLKTLPKDIKSKMWLYHYQDNVVGNKEWFDKANEDGFKGFVLQGQEFPHPLEQHS